MCSQSLQEQRDCHKAAVDLAESLHAKLPTVDVIPERMQSGQVRSSVLALLEVIKEAFSFLHKYIRTAALRMSHMSNTLRQLISFTEQLLSSQKGRITDLKSKLSEASQNLHQSVTTVHYVEYSKCEEHGPRTPADDPL